MKYIYVLIIMGLVGCGQTDNISKAKEVGAIGIGPVLERTFEGCTYIYIVGGYTHKGNCTNPIHRCVMDTVYLPAPCDSVGRVYVEFSGDTTGFSKIKGQSVHFRTVIK